MLSGYHLAFLVGAATITTGIALAVVLLRPRAARPQLQLADRRSAGGEAINLTTTDIEREAA
jgi:hypothetical protein